MDERIRDCSLRAKATLTGEADWIAATIGGELVRLARNLFELEQTIGAWAHAAGLDNVAIPDLQATDLISQTLQELAAFLDHYRKARAAGQADPIEVGLAGVKLGGLRARLVSAARDGDHVAVPAAPVDIELF
ncbi:MAG: hypothetical protein JSS35_07285 [Proteobacteria bacterium]|nr:hypothetical protein [Pseudomonadota bacterium]